MFQLNDISDTPGGLRLSERQQMAAATAGRGNSLPLRPLRSFFKNEEPTCL
ncbi:MAG TPA: hypothetical protein VKP66_09535 [Steroidobacteraceae bacterium]|nr:hypothetical protein [Steroidobacteraceae bacterium]